MLEKKRFGFTILEMLIIITVIAIIATMGFMVFNRIRRLSRDTVRLTHVTQMQTALRAYYRDLGYYPTNITLGSSLYGGNTTYMEQIPLYPSPADGDCDVNSTYVYHQLPSGSSYSITFCLGGDTADLTAGVNVAMPSGIIKQ